MFHRHIESVTLKRLSDTSFQRRGHIAVFKLIEKVNMPYIQQEAIKQIQALYAVLGYVTPPSLVGKNGEQSESWISIGEDGKEIFVQHKYWPEITVAAFRQIVEAVAPIHWWSVVREY